jgi:hypothetical protein
VRQRRTAGLIPDWLNSSASPTLHVAAAICIRGRWVDREIGRHGQVRFGISTPATKSFTVEQSSSPSGAALVERPQVLADRLTTADPDVLRELLSMFIHTLMGAEADALCGADYGGPHQPPKWVSASPIRHADGHFGSADPQAAAGLLLPGLAAGEATG